MAMPDMKCLFCEEPLADHTPAERASCDLDLMRQHDDRPVAVTHYFGDDCEPAHECPNDHEPGQPIPCWNPGGPCAEKVCELCGPCNLCEGKA